jgi:signal transduction histidine kinase
VNHAPPETKVPQHLQATLLELAALDKSEFEPVIKQIIRADARALSIERVSLWFLRQEPLSLVCQLSYLLSRYTYERSPRLLARDYPRYFEAIQRAQIIPAYDVSTDPRTSELVQGYLLPAGISSMMDIPIWVGGRLVGVLCHEHVGARRDWTVGEQQFAFSIGQMVAVALEAQERRKAELARDRLEFLARAAALLSETLEVERIPDRLLHLVVPTLADWCMIALLEQGKIVNLARAHKDPALEALFPKGPPTPFSESRHVLAQLIKLKKRYILEPEVNEEVLRRYCDTEEQFASVRRAGVYSMMAVSLGPPEQTFGCITCASATPGRHYEWEDLKLLQELAARATQSIINAQLYHQAREAIQLRDEFLSIASHELYTPLTALQLTVQRLGRKTAPDPEEQRAYRLIQKQVTRLTRLVGKLLDVSALRRGDSPLELERLDLVEVTRELVEQLREESVQAGSPLVLSAAGPVWGRWDRLRLEQIITNLLSNALKFGAGRPVEIAITEEEGRAELVIKDHGIGIEPERLPHIFERFERGVSSRSYGGLGLGLYLSYHLIRALGGVLRVDSTPGFGSTFIVELPCAGPGDTVLPESPTRQ